MQTFLPYPNFQQSAKCLDNKRLGKQRVECLQILNALAKGPITIKHSHEYNGGSYDIKTPWYNHPAVKMWREYELELCDYCASIIIEWKSRGFKDNCWYKLINLMSAFPHQMSLEKPNWLGSKEFHLSHQSNLIRKNPSYYRPIFGPEIPDNLPYIWPV